MAKRNSRCSYRAPKPIVALSTPEIGERFAVQALDITPGSPDDFRRQIAEEIERWKFVIKQTGFKLE